MGTRVSTRVHLRYAGGSAVVNRNRSRRLAAAYYRAIVNGRPLRVAARRCGVSVSTLYKHAALWPEHLSRLQRSCTLLPYQRENLSKAKVPCPTKYL